MNIFIKQSILADYLQRKRIIKLIKQLSKDKKIKIRITQDTIIVEKLNNLRK